MGPEANSRVRTARGRSERASWRRAQSSRASCTSPEWSIGTASRGRRRRTYPDASAHPERIVVLAKGELVPARVPGGRAEVGAGWWQGQTALGGSRRQAYQGQRGDSSENATVSGVATFPERRLTLVPFVLAAWTRAVHVAIESQMRCMLVLDGGRGEDSGRRGVEREAGSQNIPPHSCHV
jgi:hypothetical protein